MSTRTIHYGIIANRQVSNASITFTKSLFINIMDLSSDGDSFKVWGEDRNDRTLHIQHVVPEDSAVLQIINNDREKIAAILDYGWRLVDYVSVSDTDDWSQNEKGYYLEHFDED